MQNAHTNPIVGRKQDIMQNNNMASLSLRESDWDGRESQRQRELEEARARAAQMEKTMKWWSDCTANWREKWAKVRNERNKARDECKQLKNALEEEHLRGVKEKTELELQLGQMKKEMDKIHLALIKHAGEFNGDNSRDTTGSPDISSDGLMKNVNSEDGLVTKAKEGADLDIEEFILQGAMGRGGSGGELSKDEQIAEEKRLIQQLSKDANDEDFLMQKLSTLQLRLDEAQKTIQIEREEKNALHKSFEKFRHEFHEIREKCEELRSAKQEAVRELLTLQETHRAELRITHNSLQEETIAREALERRLCELRAELERLQAENAAEWGKRERLETEKITLERENKKLRAEVQDLQDRLERKGRPITNSDAEIRALQHELTEKNKEISDIKHSHGKMKKMLSEANTELGHAIRRAEQYETEVKRLRSRVEELKRELAGAEDELDSTCNHVRRLQRANEELSSQNENLQTQLHQLRSSSSPKHQLKSKLGFPHEYQPKPIHELKQLFDDKRHSERNRNHHHAEARRSAAYSDAKPSLIDADNAFDLRTRHMFERAKQKFDQPRPRSGSGARNRSSNIPKRSQMASGGGQEPMSPPQKEQEMVEQRGGSPGEEKPTRRGNFPMTSSINLDSLKVSDNE